MNVENHIPMLALIFVLNMMKDREEPSDLLQKRMTSFEITNYSALLCDTDEQQQNIWVNKDQLDEK